MAKLFVDDKGCWIYQGLSHEFGYGVLSLGHRGTISAHRASWIVFRGEIPEGMKVLHRCDIPPCFNPDHLFIGTQADNIADMDRKGRRKVTKIFGEAHGLHRVTKDQVIEMRKLYADDLSVSHRQLAKRFNLSASEVGRILRKDVWRF